MSYNNANLFKLYDNVGSQVAFFGYITGDTPGTVQQSGYISDATKFRLKLGDIVEVFSGTLAASTAGNTSGASLGAVTFPLTDGLTSLFTAAPMRLTMMVTALTAPVGNTPGAATLTAVSIGAADVGLDLLEAGDFGVNPWQLGTSLPFSATVTTGPDRFFGVGGASSSALMVQTAETDVLGTSAAVAWGRSSTDTHTVGLTFGQVVETKNAIRAQGKTVAVSFYAKAGANWAAGAPNGAFTVTLIAGTGVDDTAANLCSGSWTGATTVGQTVITPSTTVSRFLAFEGVVPTNATQLGLTLNYTPTGGTTAGAAENVLLYLVGAKLGPDNGLYEHKEAGAVLSTCERYLQVISEPTSGVNVGVAAYSAGSIAQVFVPLVAPMRKAPTVAFTAGGFAVMDSALGAHTITSGGGVGGVQGVTLTVTAAATLTAGLVSFLAGRTTGSGSIVARAGYEG
jgi:hypothetical protein